MRNKTGLTLLIIGGILMIISSAVGSIGIYEFLYDFISGEVHPDLIPLLRAILFVIKVIADWGGGAIIIGAILVILKQIRLGKWIIGVGLTFGSLALIVWLISEIVHATDIITDPQIIAYLDRLKGFFTYGVGLQFIGVGIALVGRNFIRKPKKEKKKAELSEEGEIGDEFQERESLTPESSES
ncbi:MAG: hypothetical protein ACFE94_17375 [Candidatus Hodarchaeota archaeon]